MLNLDTHILVLAMEGDLRHSEQALLRGSPWSISAIVLWELAKLIQLGRLDMDLDDREVVRVLNRLRLISPLRGLRPDWTSRAILRTRSSPPPASCMTCRC